MAYISGAGARPLIPEPMMPEIIQGAIQQSTVLSLFRRLPNMSSGTLSAPVLQLLPTAYWVNGELGQKKTTEVKWEKKTIHAEEIAVIVPIPENVLADASYDIWGQVRPLIEQAFGQTIDAAIFFGVNKPTNYRASIVDTAIAAGNAVNLQAIFTMTYSE